MPADLKKCKQCGKLIAGTNENDLCASCTEALIEKLDRIEEAITRWNLQTPEEIATFVGITVEETQRLIKEVSLFRSKVNRRVPCKRCREKLAQPDSDFCLDCRLELNRDLGLAVTEIISRMGKVVSTTPSPTPQATAKKIVTTLGELGKRVGSKTRGDFAPRNRYRS